jgi:hypothetical protein
MRSPFYAIDAPHLFNPMYNHHVHMDAKWQLLLQETLILYPFALILRWYISRFSSCAYNKWRLLWYQRIACQRYFFQGAFMKKNGYTNLHRPGLEPGTELFRLKMPSVIITPSTQTLTIPLVWTQVYGNSFVWSLPKIVRLGHGLLQYYTFSITYRCSV